PQPGIELGMAIGGEGFAQIVGVLVMRRGIEWFSHDRSSIGRVNAAHLRWFPCSARALGGVSGTSICNRTVRAPVSDQAFHRRALRPAAGDPAGLDDAAG